MTRTKTLTIALALAGLAAGAAVPADAAKKNCVSKAGEGTNTTEDGAKFQAFEAVLQATDWGLWSSWMATSTFPGYDVTKPKYKCTKGTGLGFTCIAQATLCKKA